MGYTRQLGQLAYLITYDGSGNITVPASITQGSVTSSMLKTDIGGKLVAAVAGTDYVAPSALSSYVPTTRTITINGTAYDLSADRSWSIVSGVSSFNTRTGAITLTSGDVTTALGYTPVTNARTITINGTTYDLSADRSWSIVSGVSSFNTRTGAITLTSGDVTGALGYTPVTNARTITINGTAYDLSADRSWSIVSGVSSFNTRTGAITLTSGDVTTALTYTPVTNARTITINGTAYDLSADRTWVVDTSSVTTRVIQKFTATSSQTTFTITGGYTVGMVDVFLNGIKLDNATEFTASNGSTVVLAAGAATGDIVEVYKYGGQFIANNTLRQSTLFTATAGQTTFTVNYSVGFVDVFYNGSKLDSSEFTATNGTSIVLGTACVLNDKVEVIAYNYTVGAFTGVGGSGTAGYHAKWTASGTLGNSLIYDNGTNVGIGTSSPSANLQVVGTAPYFQINHSSDGRYIDIGQWVSGNTIEAGAGDLLIKTQSANNLIFGTNTAERMRITSSGSVGIGTTTPSAGLHVVNAAQGIIVQQLNNASYTGIRIYNDQNSSTRALEIDYSASAYASNLLYGGVSGEAAAITTTGAYPLMLGTANTMRVTILSDGAMSFNTSAVTGRSFTYKGVTGRSITMELLESTGVHSVYLRPVSSGRHMITSDYISGGVYLPLSLSGRENDSDFVLQTNGNICIGSAADMGTKFQINGANYIEMATFAATSASASAIVSNNAGYVQFSNATARHLSNAGVITAATDGIQILKAGIVHINVSQDITTAGTTSYVSFFIRKNGSNISENLITNTNGQWDGINACATIDVAAGDVIGFYVNANDITAFDPGTWSQYSFLWAAR